MKFITLTTKIIYIFLKIFIQYLVFYDTTITVFFNYTLGEGECLPLAYSCTLYIIFYLMISVSSMIYNNMPIFIWVLIESIIVPKSNDNSPFSSLIPNIVLDRFRFWDSSQWWWFKFRQERTLWQLEKHKVEGMPPSVVFTRK